MTRPVALHHFLPGVLLASLAASLALLPAGLAQAARGRKVALLVGVRVYDHKKLEDLRFTENDVEELADVLTGFNEVVVLTSTRGERSPSAAPTAANIRAQLDRLLRRLTKHDTILIALAGHGLQLMVKVGGREVEEGFFCPSDARPRTDATLARQSETMLGFTELFRTLDDSGVGVKLLLVDACRNDPRAGRSINADAMPRAPKGMAALFSCRSGERAFESPRLGKGHGVFFYHVLEALKGKAVNARGEVTWSRLAEHVTERVSDEVPVLIGEGAKQTPEEIKKLEGKPPVLLTLGRTVAGNVPMPNATKEPPAKEKIVKDREEELTNAIGMKLGRVPAGKFLMGSPVGEKGRGTDEHLHEVEITRAFWLSVHEVTQAQFKEVMGYNPSFFSHDGKGRPGAVYKADKPAGGKDKLMEKSTDVFPVENVSYEEAVAFCERLSKRPAEAAAGRQYRLPTEAEWERACRGKASEAMAYHFGNSLSSTQANFDGNYPYGGAAHGPYVGRTCVVGKYLANGYGLHDMHGNVWEWCHDWYGGDSPRKDMSRDPQGPREGSQRVIRGGSWSSRGSSCRSAFRSSVLPAYRSRALGFRVALTLAGR
jgi:formylglycine-generating enzyme required for sulfatase activity